MLPSSDRGIYIPELGRRICSINRLIRQQRANLTEDQLIQVFNFMANFPSALESNLAHHRGRRQPAEDESSSSNHGEAGPSGVEQDTSSEVRNIPAGLSRLAQPARGGRVKAHAQRGRTRGCHARDRGGALVRGREDVARPLSRFEVDRHPSKMTARELDVIKELYHCPDYVEFRLPESSEQPTRPLPSYIAVYRDYFLKRLRLPIHPFLREALLNLEISLP